MEPTVGIVVAAHDAERYVGATLRSLQDQTWESWRCVVVDDASRDATAAVVAPFTDDPRIDLVRLDRNLGVSAARNVGTALLVDECLVTYVDSDDLLLPDALEVLVTAAVARPDAVGAYGLARYIDADGASIRPGEHERRQRDRRRVVGHRLVDVGARDDLTFDEAVVNSPVWPPAVALLRRGTVDGVGGFDPGMRTQEDWDLVTRLTRSGPLVAVDRVVAAYRQHDRNKTAATAALVRAQAAVRSRAYRHPGREREARRTVARAWRYLAARECLLLLRQLRRSWDDRDPRLAGRAAIGAVVAGTYAVLLPGPPTARYACASLRRAEDPNRT